MQQELGGHQLPLVMPIYGTRPEAIKMAPIVTAIQDAPKLQCLVAVTGQHREMLDQVNSLFGIAPDFDLDILSHGQTLNEIMSRALVGLDEVFRRCRPDAVVVQGDTTTSTAGAIAAFNLGIPVIHAEAGLRSGDISSPFPEEGNRKLTSQIAALHLAPTQESRRNLVQEGIDIQDVVVTGNSVIDALLSTADNQVPFGDSVLERVVNSDSPILLVTTHRRENQGAAMRGVGRALATIAKAAPELIIVLPIHLNPAVRNAVLPSLSGIENIVVTEPLAYGEFTRLMSRSRIVLTDSGGVQEEAPSLGKPVLVMRANTERPEAVEAGTVKLIGTEESRIVSEVLHLLHDEAAYSAMANAVNPYGDGHAARRTVAAIEELFGIGKRMSDFSGINFVSAP